MASRRQMAVKRALMRLPLYTRVSYPLWARWVQRVDADPNVWRSRSYEVGQVVRWRGVRLVCCTQHYAGQYADHPWDPGIGWDEARAAALWEPKSARDRLLLALVGDKRKRTEVPHAQ